MHDKHNGCDRHTGCEVNEALIISDTWLTYKSENKISVLLSECHGPFKIDSDTSLHIVSLLLKITHAFSWVGARSWHVSKAHKLVPKNIKKWPAICNIIRNTTAQSNQQLASMKANTNNMTCSLAFTRWRHMQKQQRSTYRNTQKQRPKSGASGEIAAENGLYWVCLQRSQIWTSTIVFYWTRVYQMQPRNGQNWHSFAGKYVHQNRDTAKIGFCTSLKSFVFRVSLTLEIKSMQISFKSVWIFVTIRGKTW